MAMYKVKLTKDHVLKGLDDLRNQELLCDVHLVAEGAKFPAHRVVLAAAAPDYFQAMFTGGFQENKMSQITLNDTSSQGLKCVLDAIYTAELSFSEENVCDVLAVASQLQLNEIVEYSKKFLIGNISAQNCLTFLAVAEKFDLQEVVGVCNKFVLENFDAVSQLPKFTDISKEQLCNYLSDDRLKTCNGEIDVYRATLKWFETNGSVKGSDKDSSDLADLVQHVRFPLISNGTLSEEILNNELILSNAQVKKMIREALQFQSNDNVFLQPLQEGKRFEPRGEKMLALIKSLRRYEGQSITGVKTKLHMINGTDSKPFQTQFSEQALTVALCPSSISVITKGNYLFIFGADVEYIRAVAMRFDVSRNTWLDLKLPPQRASVRVAVTLLNGNIYHLGGMHLIKGKENAIDPSNLSASVSQYCIETNSWSKLENLPKPLAGHSATSQGNYVFCAGGFSQDLRSTDKLYAFDVVGKIWLTKTSMNNTRTKFSLEAVGEKLVACGGKEAASVEIYDVADDQWTLIQNGILEHHADSATIVLNDKVYVIGGCGDDGTGTMCPKNCLSCVDVNNARVCKVSSFLFRASCHACALLIVPYTAARTVRSQNST